MNINKFITIKGARVNNLKNINLKIPKFKFIVVTGLSGSGKSSLVFDTLYQEGKRRYMESLSTYSRQFLGNFEKPDVDQIEGLCPAISIAQKNIAKNPRSTVGTITEIYDYIRLIYTNISIPYNPSTNKPIKIKSIEKITEDICKLKINSKILILSPIIEQKKGTHKETIKKLIQKGFNRLMINQKIFSLDNDSSIKLNQNKHHDIFVIIDRFKLNLNMKQRIYQSLKLSLSLIKEKIFLFINDAEILKINRSYSDNDFDFKIPKKDIRLFSFNTNIGACSLCKGIGSQNKFDKKLILDLDKSINEESIIPFRKYKNNFNQFINLKKICQFYKIDMNIALKKINPDLLKILLYGDNQNENQNNFKGIIPILEYFIKKLNPNNFMIFWLKSFMLEKKCEKCLGSRINEKALLFKINNKNIYELTKLSIEELLFFFHNLKLNEEEEKIISLAIKEILYRLNFLKNIGLGYLSLDRNSDSLSGGESQRIRLAKQIGSKITGILYTLDEPSIGLHPKDNDNLIISLKKIKKLGNTLLIVEHDHKTILSADYLIDIGPLAGNKGGEIIAHGTIEEIIKNPYSITGKYLSGEKKIDIPTQRNSFDKNKVIQIKNACLNNLKNINIDLPLGIFIVITGVSGSGKSTLINEILLKKFKKKTDYNIKSNKNIVIDHSHSINQIIEISQSSIGKTSRSNPVTYIGLFNHIRNLFAGLKESKIRGYTNSHFSFNVKSGRCEYCLGEGIKKISMYFLPDVFIKCQKCKGKKFNNEILEIKYKEKNIADILNMNIETAWDFFKNHLKIKKYLQVLKDVGLEYIKLGQCSNTLSGGEAQRMKLAKELHKKITSDTLYILDEPTTGLHSEDIKKLINIMHKIVKKKATIIIIEHNLDIMKNADYIIDLGPEGGINGGQIIAKGTPEEISKNIKSYTGQYLKKILEKNFKN
ncbi:excinuclease ABC subunit A [Candidatus Phytoplasma oryzae]|uniref:UvrABC system protein A n=1 Tax=Candidatus Phytoplasma oryzae TaxID=203274 RepID=A0A139JQU6_9MOLU|nr:excinuclease ABC subunit UvrA [Candidatus Phytoplasma oryzae]KXT29251.1 excinuclease ABC subunit A [Candidatus Phytoplasma oryzae]KXT29345.1 excinuclease ABC subunit A [Candidatus Phytoplasma oryzae]RAM57899.1 excinuclease ABC subunit A [Candidatus Phytoplasma oryzae]